MLFEYVVNKKKHTFKEFSVLKKLFISKNKHYLKSLNLISQISKEDYELDLSSNLISINSKISYKAKDQFQEKLIEEVIESLIPWRKGPYKILGNFIDSEWNSSLKWNRIKPYLSSIKNQNICDLGCNNGYFMFKMLKENPNLILGLDPTILYYLQFIFLSNNLHYKNLFFELMGFKELHFFKHIFDLVLCLGILYHHQDPIYILKAIHQSLKKNGKVIIDCQGINGEKDIALFPKRTYAAKKGFWFLPTLNCLKNWIKRSGFQDCEVIFLEKIDWNKEQRMSKHSPFNSLKEGLLNEKETVEGYSVPVRFYLIAYK